MSLYVTIGPCFSVSEENGYTETANSPFRRTLVLAQKIPGPLWGSFVLRDMENRLSPKTNPRAANRTLRNKYRARLRSMDAPCGICKGRLGPIHYDEPSDALHPLSFVIDEIKPVSRWKEFGYDSPRAAAEDWSNLQAAHRICNAAKGAKLVEEMQIKEKKRLSVRDGEW